MSRYELGSRAKVKDHIPAGESLSILLRSGVLVLFRAGLLAVAPVLIAHYGSG